MESCECCAHSPDKSIARKDNEPVGCCRSMRISEKPEPSSARKHAPGCPKLRRTSEEERRIEVASCYDKFALAKRLHAENLRHQPLPDRVDDSVFKRGHGICLASCERAGDRAKTKKRAEEACLFRPVLGCKEPKTRMDLAICWETPVDPVYEPRRSAHIDGSGGGSAPAIFAMIQHKPAPRNREFIAIRSTFPEGKDECICTSRKEDPHCCNCLRAEPRDGQTGSGRLSRSTSVPRITERRCAGCGGGEPEVVPERKRKGDPRLIRSAVGVALGLEQRNRTDDDEEPRKNGQLSTRTTAPRPRTPFARRAFCIDTLAPPFSVMDGCRDTDYPEHWRLMTVHQQSYRHPQRRRIRHF